MTYTIYYPGRTMDGGVTWEYLRRVAADPAHRGARAVPDSGAPGDTLVLAASGWVYEDTGYRPGD